MTDMRTAFADDGFCAARGGPAGRRGAGGDFRRPVRQGRGQAPGPGAQRGHQGAADGQRGRRAGAGRDAADRAHLRAVPGRAGLRAGQARSRAPGRARRAGQHRGVVRRGPGRADAPGAGRRGADRQRARVLGARAGASGARCAGLLRGAVAALDAGSTYLRLSTEATGRRGRSGRGCRWCVRGGGRWWWRWGRCSTRCSTRWRTWT